MAQSRSPVINNPIIITAPVRSTRDLFHELSRAGSGAQRPEPHNLDAMADFIKELQVKKILCAQWRMPAEEARRVARVFADLGVELKL